MTSSYDSIQALRSALDARRRSNPRPRLPRDIGVYINDRILLRPIYAINQLARLSEFLLARSYLGLAAGKDKNVSDFYDEVQESVKRLLEKYDPAALRSRDNTPILRKEATDLLAHAKTLVYLLQIPVDPKSLGPTEKGNVHCSFCHGKGMTPQQRRLFKYALLKMIKVGVLPESFKMFA